MTKAGRQHGAQAPSPSAVTLGETPRQGAQRGQVGAKVDWFTVTWRPEPDEHFVATVLDFLRGLGIAYGKLVHTLRGVVTSDELLDLISRPGVPTRLEKATLAGFNAASCVAQLE